MTAQSVSVPPSPSSAPWDRAAGERTRDGLIAEALAGPDTRVLAVRGDTAPLAGGDTPRLLFVRPEDLSGAAGWAFLGRDPHGAATLVAAYPETADEPVDAPGGWAPLRAVGGTLDAESAELFVEALALARWIIDAPYCPACGSSAELAQAGWSRWCASCAREHFPRTDPAVIVAVQSADGERLLLGSNALWGQDRYSCFAGFVEAGESLEGAVAREVEEESGVRVRDVVYRGSQAWPYPRSLMLGFWARAADDDAARADGEEIVQVRWFTRDDVADALAGRSDVKLPGTASIAHRLIRDWLDRR